MLFSCAVKTQKSYKQKYESAGKPRDRRFLPVAHITPFPISWILSIPYSTRVLLSLSEPASLNEFTRRPNPAVST